MSDPTFEELAVRARSITDQCRVRHEPPSSTWHQIAVAIHDSPSSPTKPTSAPVVPDTALAGPGSGGSKLKFLAAGIAAAAALPALIIGMNMFDDNDPVTFVADIDNEDLPVEFDGTARAVVEVDDSPSLELEFSTEIPPGEPIELWLASDGCNDLVSLGTLREGTTSWAGDWPEGIDPEAFFVINLSFEPDDGDPGHSGRTILRGELSQS